MSPAIIHFPLCSRPAEAILAVRPQGPVSVGRFLAEATWLAPRLPAGDWLLNACEDRYGFSLAFVAGLLAGKTSLQPASHAADTLARIGEAYPGAFCVRDGDFDAGPLPVFALPTPPAELPALSTMPTIATERIVAILFTSGSTGQPQPQPKSWGKLVINARSGAAALGLDRQPQTIVGTVPAQHSFGFESTFLLALHGGCAFWSGKPFFPQDIASALAAVPAPKMLVTTPFHLAALLAADLPLPPADLVLSATAPLSATLAAAAEARFAGAVHEIYGSTESGQLATRRTTDGEHWTRLPGVQLVQEGDITHASGEHVEGAVPLGDRITLLADGRFLLQGRHADLINIAGKRTSLAYLNHQIASVPGVCDATFFLPDEKSIDGVTRLAAFVVAPTLDSRRLTAALRQRIDPIFLPRPIVFVAALPRNATGKLPRAALQRLLAERDAHG